MRLVEGSPRIERIGQLVKLVLPCSKGGFPAMREYALTRAQLTALIAEGIDALDEMDREAAASVADVLPLVRAG